MNTANDSRSFEQRQPNWLPLPVEEKSTPRQSIVEDDLFPKADVTEFYPQQGVGELVDPRGLKHFFNLDEIELVGSRGAEAIAAGIKVGYDLSRTSEGIKITKLKIY